jgi:hypothetical protein
VLGLESKNRRVLSHSRLVNGSKVETVDSINGSVENNGAAALDMQTGQASIRASAADRFDAINLPAIFFLATRCSSCSRGAMGRLEVVVQVSNLRSYLEASQSFAPRRPRHRRVATTIRWQIGRLSGRTNRL